VIGEENNDRKENPRSRVYLPFGFRKKSIPNPYTARDADLDRLVLEGIPTVNLGRGIPDPTPFGADSGLMRSQSRRRLARTIGRLIPKNRSDSGAMADEKKPTTPSRNETPYGGDQTIIEQVVSEARFQKDLASRGEWKEIHYDHYDWWAYPIDRGSAQYGDFYNVAGEPIKRLRNNMDFIKALTDTILVQTRALGYNLYEKTWMQDPEWEKGQDWGLAYPTRIWKMTRSAQIFGLEEEFESLINMQKVLQESGIRFNHRKYWESPGTVDDVPPIESYDEPKTYFYDYSLGAKPRTPYGEGGGSSPYYPTEYDEWEAGIDTEPRVGELEPDDFESAVAGAFELADLLREKSEIGDLEYPYHHISPDRREDIADTIDFALTLIPIVDGDGFDTDRKETADALEKFVVGDDLYRDDSELLDELILQLRDSTYDGFFSFDEDSGRMSVEPKMNRFNDRVTTLYNEGKTREEIAKELDLSVRQVDYLLNKLFAGGLAKSRHTQREKTEELIERVVTMHNEGKRTTEIAEELGLTNNRVQRYQYIARRRGLLTTPRKRTTAETDELMNEAARLYNEGKPRMDIAKEMNLPGEKIGTLLQRANERKLIRDYNPQGLGKFGKTTLTPEKISAAADGYRQGKTFAQIAEELAVTETAARKLVVQARRLGLDTGSPRRRTPSQMEELLLEVAVRYEEGKTFAEIGQELDVTPSAIRDMVDRAVTLGLIRRRERTRSDTDELMNQVMAKRKEGKTRREIAQELNVPENRVAYLVQRARLMKASESTSTDGFDGETGRMSREPERGDLVRFGRSSNNRYVDEPGSLGRVVKVARDGTISADFGNGPIKLIPGEDDFLVIPRQVDALYELTDNDGNVMYLPVEDVTYPKITRAMEEAMKAGYRETGIIRGNMRTFFDEATGTFKTSRIESRILNAENIAPETTAPVPPQPGYPEFTRIVGTDRARGGGVDSGAMELPDGIDEELEDYVYDDPLFGPSIKHPLFFWIAPITPEVTDLINASFAQKRASADEALAKKNWGKYIYLHERPYRIDAFEDVMDEMTDQEYWSRLSDIWVDSENIGAQPSRWRELLLSDRGSRESFMNENERAELAKLPQKFTVYRGYSENDQEEFGMSWSTDAEVAEWFARRFARDDEKIIMESLEISKDEVFAYVTRRGEDEIILDIRNVVERTAKKQQLPRKPKTRIPSKNRNLTPPGDSGAMSSLSKEQIDEMTQRYKDGDSVLELANDYSVTQGTVYYHLRRKGVARRPVGRRKKPGGFSAIKRRLKDSLGQIGLFAAFSNDPQKTLRSSNQMKTYLLSEPVRTPDDLHPDEFALRPNFVRAAIAAGLGLFKALNHKTFKVQGPIAREFTELMVGPKMVNDAIGTTYPTLQELGEIFAANAIVRARIRSLFGINDPTALAWAIQSGAPLREGGERIFDIPESPPYTRNLVGGGYVYFEGIDNRRPFVLSVMANMPEAVRSKLYWDSDKIPWSKRDVPITVEKGELPGGRKYERSPVDEVLPLFVPGHDTSRLDLIKTNHSSPDGARLAQYVEMAKEEIRQWAADHDEWARRWAQSVYRIMSEAGLSDDEIAEVINRDWLQNITFGIGDAGDILQNAMFMALLMTRSKFAPVVHLENGFDDPNLALHEFFHVHLGQGFTRHGEYVAFRGPAEVYDSWYPHTLFALTFNSAFWQNVVKESGGTEELRKEMRKAVEKMLAPEYDSDVRLLFELFPEYQRASAEIRKKLNEMIMAEIIEDFEDSTGFRRVAGMPRATEIINAPGFRIPKRLWPWGSSYGGKERIADVQGKTYAKFEERIFGVPDPTSGDGGNTGKMSLERTPKFDGGHSSRGRGTPLGDGKDVAMREVADSAIVELVGNRGSSSLTTLRFLGPYRAGSRVVMLARNGELRGVPLKNETRSAIANAQRNGARFVVGDMPDVDSQFVDFLEEIGADYTIYHAGNSPRFRPGSKIPGTNAGTLSETRAGESDSPSRLETIGRNLATAAAEVVAAGFEVKVYGGRSDSQSGSNPIGGMLSALNKMRENPDAPTGRKLAGLTMMMSAMEKYLTDSTNQRLVVVSRGDRVVGASLIKFPEKDSVAELRYAGSLSPVRGVGSAMVAEIMRLAADSGRSIIGTSSQDSVSFWRGVGGKDADWDGPYRGNTIFEIDDVRKVVAAIDARRKELRAQKLLGTTDGGNPR